jgi:GntR family transcriptional regulator, transcriptional repressor for pyruvate dehydrogenase complex
MFEARRILEVSAAGMAAERATPEQLAAMAEEIADQYASMDDPQAFLVHDIRFHRSVAAASGNPIVASLVEMVSALFYDERTKTARRATERNHREAAERHHLIYKAIRARKPARARRPYERTPAIRRHPSRQGRPPLTDGHRSSRQKQPRKHGDCCVFATAFAWVAWNYR